MLGRCVKELSAPADIVFLFRFAVRYIRTCHHLLATVACLPSSDNARLAA